MLGDACGRKCFVRLQLLLVAVALPSPGGRQAARVILNPSGAGRQTSATVIDADMKGFFICQSQDDAKRVLYYCDSCHGNVTVASLINRCACVEKGEKNIVIVTHSKLVLFAKHPHKLMLNTIMKITLQLPEG